MEPAVGPSVTVVLPPDDTGVRVVAGALVERSASALAIAVDDPTTVTPGEAVVVVVHDEPTEVLLAIGLAPDGPNDHVRLRVVERRD